MNVLAHFIALGAVSVVAARADEVVIPAANEFANANTQINTPLREAGNPRSLQVIVGRPATNSIPAGSLITGLSFRAEADGSGAWPAAALSFSSYQVTVASATNPATSFLTNFANNQFADVRTVYSGPLAIAPGAYPGGAASGGVNAFGPLLAFTAPFAFDGQDLAITIRHPGSSAATGTTRFLDALNNTSAAYGVGGVAAISATSASATTGSGAPAPVVRFRFAPPGLSPSAAVPSFARYIPGTITDALTLGNAPRTVQWVIDARQMGDAPAGSTIEGLRFRLGPGKPGWPLTTVTLTQFDVSLATSLLSANAMSETFAANTGADSTLVRSGSLTFPASAAGGPDVGAVPPAALVVPFSTPYTYAGGGLAVLVRHSASGVAGPGLDALNAQFGVNAFADGASNATTGVSTVVPVVHLDVRSAAAIPAANAGVAGPSQNALIFTSAPSTLQMIIGADQLTAVPPGSTIDGISFRIRGATSWPTVSAMTTRLDITLARAGFQPGGMVADVGQNRARPENGAAVVRSGAWVASKESFSGTLSASRRWGPTIRFDRPYVYQGGPLHVAMTCAGFPTGAGSAALDALSPGAATLQAGIATTLDAQATSVDASAPVLRLHFTPGVTRPGSAGVASGGLSTSWLATPASRVQVVISMDDLAPFAAPLPITGIAVRLADGASAGPRADTRIGDLRVRVAPATVVPKTISARFEDNRAESSERVVRQGSFTVPAFALRGASEPSAPAPASLVIPFDVPYLWRGGDLCVTLEASGVDGEAISIDSAQASSASAAAFDESVTSERGQLVNPPVLVLMHAKHQWRSPADIADDAGNAPPTGVNNSLTEADYNAFFRNFFENNIIADIADDQGNALPSELPNNGLSEGDYNLFFRVFFGF